MARAVTTREPNLRVRLPRLHAAHLTVTPCAPEDFVLTASLRGHS